MANQITVTLNVVLIELLYSSVEEDRVVGGISDLKIIQKNLKSKQQHTDIDRTTVNIIQARVT